MCPASCCTFSTNRFSVSSQRSVRNRRPNPKYDEDYDAATVDVGVEDEFVDSTEGESESTAGRRAPASKKKYKDPHNRPLVCTRPACQLCRAQY
jgi:hypothetical protein